MLSRFTPAASEEGDQPSGELYVMQLDCSQQLYRDKQVNLSLIHISEPTRL